MDIILCTFYFISMKSIIERYQEAGEDNNCPLLNPISEVKVRYVYYGPYLYVFWCTMETRVC
jgi:hypothetical protein